MIFDVILNEIKYLRIYNVSNSNLYQNRFIDECTRKKKAKISKSQCPNFTVYVRCRRTYVLNNQIKKIKNVRYMHIKDPASINFFIKITLFLELFYLR